MKIVEEAVSATTSLAVLSALIVLVIYWLHDKDLDPADKDKAKHPLQVLRHWLRVLLRPLADSLRGVAAKRAPPREKTWSITVTRDEQGLPAIAQRESERESESGVDSDTALHGRSVADPFHCLEDLQHPGTHAFLRDELQATEDYLQQSPSRALHDKFLSRYLSAQSFESIENPVSLGGTYFFFKRLRPELPQFSLFATKDLNTEARLVFDPNTLRLPDTTQSTHTSHTTHTHNEQQQQDPSEQSLCVHATWISVDGQRVAFGFTRRAADRSLSLGVRDLRTGTDLSDRLHGCLTDYTTVAWVDSRSGFFYTLAAETERDGERVFAHRVLFHRLGGTQRDDLVVFETRSRTLCLSLGVQITSDGHYLLLDLSARQHERSAQSGWGAVPTESALSLSPSSPAATGNKVYYFDLARFDGATAASLGACVRLIDTLAHRFDYLSNIEDEFWFRTNYHAPAFRVVRLTLPELSSERERDGEREEDEDGAERELRAKREAYKCLQAWKTSLDWIPQRGDGAFLESGAIAAHTVLVLKYAKLGAHEVLLYDLTQELVAESQIPVADLPHPAHGTISGPNCSFYSSEIFYRYSDLADPASIYRALVDRDPYSGAIEISFSQVNSTEVPGVDKYKFDVRQSLVRVAAACASQTESDKDKDGRGREEDALCVPILKFALRSVLDVESDSESESESESERRRVVHSLRREDSPPPPALLSPAALARKRSAAQHKTRAPRPCIVCVNSGFGVSVTPTFSLPLFLFAQHCQGLVVIANVRGSGVLGESFSRAGARENKQRAVDDLLAVLRFLVRHNFTSYAQLALYGGTYNGAVIGAAVAQSPMLFNAAVVEDGLFDLLRMHRLNAPLYSHRSGLCGAYTRDVDPEAWRASTWCAEFGAAEESEEEMERLLALSPLHNLHRLTSAAVSTYPAVLCCTDLSSTQREDSDVVSCKHTLKFVAQLQRCLPRLDCKRKPLLLYVNEWERDTDTSGDDDAARSYTEPSAEDLAVKFAFIMRNISATWHE